ncbi:hypothetical protein EYF80_064198 [Liparis tanakae]|uniref:Uncharacterized protein n=1 Tax=Liparis tanakae TaxID=230148 RepID=A0A4Z2EA96_9TELE|nr:hypothetical protein EYF80_064198 [Liparis tanakae]
MYSPFAFEGPAVPLQLFGLDGRGQRLQGGPGGRRAGARHRRVQSGPGLRGHRRRARHLPVLPERYLLRPQLQPRRCQPRRAGGRLRSEHQGEEILDREEQLGRDLGQAGLHPDGS